jgi:hypothetical protein
VKILVCLNGNKKDCSGKGLSSKKVQMKRRDFEKTAATTAVLGLGLSLSSFESSELKKLTILHTMMHSHIDPFLPTIREIQIWAVWREELH